VRRIAGAAALTAALLAACSGAPSADEVLSRASDSLADIRSGELHLSVLVETAPGADSSRIGFEIDGPFAFGGAGELPEARITYKQIAGEDELEVTLTSTGETAYQTVAGQTTEMSEPQLEELRATGVSEGGGFGTLDVQEWIDDAELRDGGRRGATDVYLVTGSLDVVAALNGMVDAATAFGASGAAGLEHLDAAGERAIESSVESSSVKIYAGEEDGLLRALNLLVEFQANADKEVLDALGPLAGARLSIELSIDDPNEPVDVEAPPGIAEEGTP
jgi:hypothetical protein